MSSPASLVPPAAPLDLSVADETRLREALKRCSPATIEAAQRFRQVGDLDCVPTIVRGVIERFVEREHRDKLAEPGADLRLVEDLGIDSLTMMEIVMLAEEALPITIANEELRFLRTLGDVEQFIGCKLRGIPPPPPRQSVGWYLDDVKSAHEAAQGAPGTRAADNAPSA